LASLGPSSSSSGSADKAASSLSGTGDSHHSNLVSLAVLTALRIIAARKWRRRVGPEPAGQVGLRAHVEVTGARNAMGAARHFDEAPSANSMTPLSGCGSPRLTPECP